MASPRLRRSQCEIMKRTFNSTHPEYAFWIMMLLKVFLRSERREKQSGELSVARHAAVGCHRWCLTLLLLHGVGADGDPDQFIRVS